MLVKTNAVVLHTLKYGDRKIIVDFYTEQLGRVTSVVKLSLSQRTRLKKQLFQPLTLLAMEIDYRPRQQMQKISDARLLAPWQSLCFEPAKMTVGIFLAEILTYATRTGQPDFRLYGFVETSLQWLDLATEGTANFHIAFLVMLTKYLGWDIQHADNSWQLGNIVSMTYENMDGYLLSRNRRQAFLEHLMRYYRQNIPSFPEPKSLHILQQIFD
ncbi:MAG: DNA repair protein RecO [Bacteroidales bacterium]|nr:DNA repair protein RecO [Bacteroidales bacterium]MCM1146867.1 DNA repair protein RecO [Bacteroidales bacterium]MCM1205635.1 DNA repair protein RecO [Bacillota bacterium]MCM1510253.1 DNA repair protein RecO [Clostridium sp.]